MFGITTTIKADPFRESQDYEVPTLGSVMNSKPIMGEYSSSSTIKQDFPKTVPTPDSRYSDYAAPMEDGRLVTDYRPNCVSRAPYGFQNATKGWLVKNADEVIRVGRRRQAEMTGAVHGAHYMGPKPAAVQECGAYSCTRKEIDIYGGVGVERMNASAAPESAYYGSFDPVSLFSGYAAGKKHIGLTRYSEGGVNSAGGRKPIDAVSRQHVL